MQTIQLILFIGLTGYSLYSLAVYAGRRSQNKSSLRQLQEQGRRLRKLTPEEKQLLQPFLHDPLRPQKAVTLLNDEVYQLDGEFLRHGLHMSNGGNTMHDTLGGVDVVLPYDALDFLDTDNKAEVVLTPKFAIVIRLNETFDLSGGRQRTHDAQAVQQQWKAGQTGAMEAPPSATSDEAQQLADDNEAKTTTDEGEPAIETVRILGQRNETPAEAAARAHPGWGMLPALTLLAAFALLMIAGHSDSYLVWLILSTLLFTLALWLFWRRRKPAEPQKINRVEGSLNLVVLQNPSNSTVVRSQLFLGDQIPLTLPKQWEAFAAVPPDSQVTLEMRVDDYSLVTLGKQLSIDEEERRFPSLYWGRHLTMALAGLAILIVAWLFEDNVGADLAHAQAAFLSGETLTYEQADHVIAQPPGVGSMVRVRAQTRCQILPPAGFSPQPVDCSRVRWGGSELQVEEVEPAAELLAIYDGSIVQAEKNAFLDMMVQMRMARTDLSERMYMTTPSLRLVRDLTQLILTVDQECHREGTANKDACSHLQELMGSKLVVAGDEEGDGWDSLLKRARNGTFKQGDDAGIASEETVDQLRSRLQEVVTARMSNVYATALHDALLSQHGGVVLPLEATLPFGDYSSSAPAAPYPAEKGPDGWPSRWQQYRQLASPAGLKPFERSGIVTALSRDVQGDLVLMIDPSRNRDNAAPALLRLFALAIGAVFLLTHGVFSIATLLRARLRDKDLAEFYGKKTSSHLL